VLALVFKYIIQLKPEIISGSGSFPTRLSGPHGVKPDAVPSGDPYSRGGPRVYRPLPVHGRWLHPGRVRRSDSVGSSQIAALTGRDMASFTPLVPQWEPPSAEIEAALFCAAGGLRGLVAGYIFGRWKVNRTGTGRTDRPGA